MKAVMTGRERLAAMLEHRDHDRIPRYEAFWPETLARWRDEGCTVNVAQWIGYDLGKYGHLAPVPYPGRSERTDEPGGTYTLVNEYGATVRLWQHKMGTPEHLDWACRDADIWHREFRPRLMPDQIRVDLEPLRKGAAAAEAAGLWTCLGSRGPFCYLETLVGDVSLLMAMAAEPDWFADMATVVTDAFLEQYRQVLDGGLQPDGLWIYDDLAYTAAPFFSPAMYRELLWPHHERMCRFAREHGLKVIFHTDGDVRPLVEDLLAAGVDCLQPLEAKAGMDVRELAPRIGDRVAFMGNIDMTVAITNDRDAVEAEVVAKLEAGMSCRGYAYHSDHSVPNQVSWSTYQWIMELVERHGNYS